MTLYPIWYNPYLECKIRSIAYSKAQQEAKEIILEYNPLLFNKPFYYIIHQHISKKIEERILRGEGFVEPIIE